MVVANQIRAWDQYVDDVVSGRIVSCKMVRLACQRHLDDLVHGHERGLKFDTRLADRVIRFFSNLTLTKGVPAPGRPFVPGPWQQFILVSLFAWVHVDTGLRRFRRGNVMVARKNGKSHLFAGIGLYALIADNEIGADVYSAATTRDQARFIWDACKEFRRVSGDMAAHVKQSVNSLFVPETNSKLMALSADVNGLDGLNVHVGLIDELQNHKTRDVFARIDTSTGARSQPLILTIATAGTDRESVCWKEHEYACNVLEGTWADDTYFAYLAEADEEDDWELEETWKKANPNLNVSVNIEDLRRKAVVAKNQPSALNDFKRLHLNMWTQQDRSWMPMHRWDECGGECVGVAEVTENGRTVEKVERVKNLFDRQEVEAALLSLGHRPWGGLDLSERGDITALMLLFPPNEHYALWTALGYYFVPSEKIEERVKRDRVRYDVWRDEGKLFVTDGSMVDYDFVRAEVMRLHHKFGFKGLAVDPHNASMLNKTLQGEGVPITEVQQGWRSLSDPTKMLMEWTLSKKLAHLNDPILRWMAGNVAIWKDAAGNIKPDKEKARERIDGISALVNAIFLATKAGMLSPYQDRGILTI